MSLESEMRAVLVADAGVAALASTRIYPYQRAEDSSLPAVVYRTIVEDAKQSLQSEVALSESTVEYECIDDTVAGAKSLAEAVRQALAGSTTLATVSPVAIRHVRSVPRFYDPFDGSSDATYSVAVEFAVLHRTPSLT